MNKKEQTRTKYYIKKNPYKETYTNSDLYDFETSKISMYGDNDLVLTKIPTSIIVMDEIFKDGKWEIEKDTIKGVNLYKPEDQREFSVNYVNHIHAKLILDEGLESFLLSYGEITFEEVQSIINFYKDAFSYSVPMKKRQLDAILEMDKENIIRVEKLNNLQRKLDKAREDLEINLQIQSILQKHILDANKSKD